MQAMDYSILVQWGGVGGGGPVLKVKCIFREKKILIRK